MTNEATGGLPANVLNMAAALANSAAQAGSQGSGELFAKMTKFGEFVYGADNTEFEEGSVWAVNPQGFFHGFTAWGTKDHGTDGSNVGEVMVPATTPMPLESELPQVKGNWAKAVGIQMRCTDGEDEGTQVLFKTNSVGGRKAYASLLQAVIGRIQAGKADCVPLVECESDHYVHKTYGKIFTPEFKIVGWANMDGNKAEEPAGAIEAPEEEPAEEPEAAPRRRRRKA